MTARRKRSISVFRGGNVMTKMAEFRAKDQVELNKNLESLLREQFKLRLVRASGELTEVSRMKKVRRDIARILTLLGSKK